MSDSESNTRKVVAADAQSFRDVGLDDPAYIDVLNTVAIQTSLDRLANVLGVRPALDGQILVTRPRAAETAQAHSHECRQYQQPSYTMSE